MFCLEMIITHISYGHHFMTCIFFFYPSSINFSIQDHWSCENNHKTPFRINRQLLLTTNHRKLTKPTQLSQTTKPCSAAWIQTNLSVQFMILLQWISQKPTQKHTHQSFEGQPILLCNLILSFSSLEDEPLTLPLSPKPVSKSSKATYFQPSEQQSVQNHNMLHIIKLIYPHGYFSKNCDCIIAKGFFLSWFRTKFTKHQAKLVHNVQPTHNRYQLSILPRSCHVVALHSLRPVTLIVSIKFKYSILKLQKIEGEKNPLPQLLVEVKKCILVRKILLRRQFLLQWLRQSQATDNNWKYQKGSQNYNFVFILYLSSLHNYPSNFLLSRRKIKYVILFMAGEPRLFCIQKHMIILL
ncbi:hypothetical protein VP01_875g1 [Puccinia sorghi]|uniref:Uncharacterized protein n=1 Tax=Puccinia sorghi TaxID=27349 RepID=A0A0L6U8N0_9BASI|nr:hypothetical protein VP01_875g1 [Puccinia sorghi]